MAAAGSGTRSASASSAAIRTRTRSSSVEFWATGTMREVTPKGIGPQIQLKSMYGQIGYDFPGMRLDITRADGQREIQVVSGTFAWNEIDKIGGGLQPGWGSAVPAMETVTRPPSASMDDADRAVQGRGRRPAAKAQVTIENGAVVLTFPFTAGKPMTTTYVVVGQLEGIPVKVTLDSLYRPVRTDLRFRDRALRNDVFGIR